MKLAYLVSEFPAISHTFILSEIEELKARGREVVTVSVNKPKHLSSLDSLEHEYFDKTFYIKENLKKEGLVILSKHLFANPIVFLTIFLYSLEYNLLRGKKSLVKSCGYFLESIVLYDFIKKQGVEKLHIHFANSAVDIVLPLWKKGLIDYSLSVHGPEIFYNIHENLLIDKFGAAEFIRVISYYCQGQVMKFLKWQDWDKIHIIHCGIDTEFYTNEVEKNNKKIVCVGRLTNSKGQLILIKALERLGEEFSLKLIGSGEDEDSLKNYVTEHNIKNVEFAGALSRSKTLESLKEASIFVLPSFAEGVPVSLMEAMNLGLITIGTKINGIEELIDNGVNGYVLPSSNIDALVELITSIDMAGLNYIKVEAKNKVEVEFNIKKTAVQMVDLFEKYEMG